jgi:hypothetical protein
VNSLLADIANRQQSLMLGGSLSTNDALTLAVVVQRLSLDVAQHWTDLARARAERHGLSTL